MVEPQNTTEVAREALRAKLPDDVLALLDAAKDDPGAPFEPGAVAMLSAWWPDCGKPRLSPMRPRPVST